MLIVFNQFYGYYMDKRPLSNSDFNIMQWNSQSVRPKMACLSTFLNQENIHIALVSETWLEDESSFHISEYNIFRRDRSDGYGGVAIMTHKAVQTQVCPIFMVNSGIEVVCVKILNFEYIEYVVSVYCPSSVRTCSSDWDSLFSKFSRKSLIAGDFNAHHTNWSYKNDPRGFQIYESSFENNYIALNDGRATRIKLVNQMLQESSPDVSFASTDIATKFYWKTCNENLGSDHLIIKLHIRLRHNLTAQFINKRNFKLANWKEYKEDLIAAYTNYPGDNSNDLQSKYNYFQDQILNSASKNIPCYKVCTDVHKKFKPKHYWSPALSHIIAQRRLALKQFRHNPTPDNLIKLESKIEEARRMIKKAKSESWKKFCCTLDHTTSVSDMWRKMRWMKGEHKTQHHPSQEKLTQLLCSLAPDTVAPSCPTFESNNLLLESKFTMQELKHCLKQNDSAPGDDQITYSMIFNLPEIGLIILLGLYNEIFVSSIVPLQWQNIKLCLYLKLTILITIANLN